MRRAFKFLWLIVLPMMLGLTSCSSYDDPVEPTHLSNDISLKDLNKLMSATPYVDISYYMMEKNTIRVWAFNADKTFVAYDLFLDDEEDGSFQVEESTGRWSAFINGKNEWEENNTDELVGFEAIYDEYSDAFSEASRTERFYAFPTSDGKNEDGTMFFLSKQALDYLYAAFLEESQQNESGVRAMTRATSAGDTPSEAISTIGGAVGDVTSQDLANKEAMEALYRQTMAGLNAAGRTEAGYNINAKTFTRDNWREQKFIYRYTGDGNQVDENGSAGYTREALPWATDQAVSSHLPFNFCDDMQPATGWDLVFNAVGEYDVKNRDFFAVYNKFTGQLRFFVFLPNLNVADANDHAWEVTLSQQLAHRLNYRFGIPISQNIVNKEPLGLRGSDYSYLVTPWVDSKTNDGFAPPGGGWWAFDIDLSQYRPDFQALNERIRMEMRVWSNSKVSLRGTLNAMIKQKNEETMVSSLTGLVMNAKDAYGGISSLITNLTTGNWIGAFTSTIAAAKGAYKVIRNATNAKKKYYGQTVPQPQQIVHQYAMDGTIDTEGIIQGSRTVSGINTITYPMSLFDVSNSTLGQGVWNLKTPPTLIGIGRFNYSDAHNKSGLTDLFPQYGNDNRGIHYTLDPRSIDVVLNPNVFPKDQIEWKRVTAVCGVRKGTKHDTYNAYRSAIGMSNNDPVDYQNIAFFNKVDNNNPCYDYLYDADDKQGLTFPKCWEKVETYTESARKGEAPHHLVGRGDDDFMLEPTQFSSSLWEDYQPGDNTALLTREVLSPWWIPSYEVTVTVTVKLKDYDTPFVMTRAYLPNYTLYTQDDVNHRLKEEHDKLDKWLADLKADATNKTEWQEYQVQHIKSQFNFMYANYYALQTENIWLYIPKGWTASSGTEGEIPQHLFDHCLATKWFSQPAQKINGNWVVEFASNVPCTAKSYTLTAPTDVESHPSRNPREWAIYGKKQATDPEWNLLDYRNSDVAPEDAMIVVNSGTKTYDMKFPGEYSAYRLVVFQTVANDNAWNLFTYRCWISISCLDFNF